MNEPQAEDTGARFRVTLFRVLLVQVITLLLLWVLQSRYGG